MIAEQSSNKKPGPQRAPEFARERLLDVQVYVVNYERGLQTRVFTTSETDLNRLSNKRVHAERTLLVPGRVVQVGERAQSRQYRSARVEHLDLQTVKGGGRGGFSGIDVQPESQGR
jgi:hypothetical protein